MWSDAATLLHMLPLSSWSLMYLQVCLVLIFLRLLHRATSLVDQHNTSAFKQSLGLPTLLLLQPSPSTRHRFPMHTSQRSLFGPDLPRYRVKQLQSLIAGDCCAGMPHFLPACMQSTASPHILLYGWLFKGPLAHCCSVKLVLLAALTQQAHQPSETFPFNCHAWYMLDKP